MPMPLGKKVPYADHSRKVEVDGKNVIVRDRKGVRKYEYGDENTAHLAAKMLKSKTNKDNHVYDDIRREK